MSWRDYTGLSEDKDRLTIYIPKTEETTVDEGG